MVHNIGLKIWAARQKLPATKQMTIADWSARLHWLTTIAAGVLWLS